MYDYGENEMKSFNQSLDARTMHLEIYAMLLVYSDSQPEVRLEWFEQMLVEDTAILCDDIYA
jgi:hypothetical protein